MQGPGRALAISRGLWLGKMTKGVVCVSWSFCNKVHKLGGLTSINLFFHGSGGWKSEIKVSPGLVPSGSYEWDSVPTPCSSF